MEKLENYLDSLESSEMPENKKGEIEDVKEKAKDEAPATKMEIVRWPELAIKGLDEKLVFQKSKDKKIQLRKFPKDLKWEQISITFLNEQEVIIKTKNETHQATYELLGFQDEKRKLPNKQWMLLRLLAVQGGSITWQNNNKLTLKQINAIKKQKQLLSDGLKAYFQINSDPFWDYKKEDAYKIKIGLVPEKGTVAPSEKDIYEDDDNDDLDTQIKKSYLSQTPEKYKDEKYNENNQ